MVVLARRCPSNAPRNMQPLPVHDCVRGVRMAQVMQPRVRHDRDRIARPDPEPIEDAFAHRFVLVFAGKHALPGRRFGEAIQQLARRLAQQKVPRSNPPSIASYCR